MRLEEPCARNEALKKVPRDQRTLAVKPSARSAFSQSLFHSLGRPSVARMVVRTVVFEPHAMNELCRGFGLPADDEGVYLYEYDVVAEAADEVLALLTACHSDWVDTLIYNESADAWVYKDHDEYTTIYANSSCRLKDIICKMVAEGHEEVVGWTREPLA